MLTRILNLFTRKPRFTQDQLDWMAWYLASARQVLPYLEGMDHENCLETIGYYEHLLAGTGHR